MNIVGICVPLQKKNDQSIFKVTKYFDQYCLFDKIIPCNRMAEIYWWKCISSHFTDEETNKKKLSNLLKDCISKLV